MAKSKRSPGPGRSHLPRMRDVAALASVSPMTVSRVLRGDSYVAKDTRARVEKVIDELGYVPDNTPSALAHGRTGFVATLIPSIDNSNFARTVSGITEVLSANGLQLLLGDTDYRAEREEDLVGAMLRRRPEAIVVTGGAHTGSGRRMLERSGIPVIEMWDLPADPIGDAVGFSHAAAGGAMAAYLAQRGYRKLAFVGGATWHDTRGADRRAGFLAATRKLGLEEPKVITFGDPPITMEQGGRAIAQLLDQWPDVEAVMCVSDLSAFGAIMECHRRGLAVPSRLAIAGFGDFEIAETCHPSITTVTCDWRELGRSVANQILSRLREPPAGEAPHATNVAIDYRVVARESA